eukprot:UN07603
MHMRMHQQLLVVAHKHQLQHNYNVVALIYKSLVVFNVVQKLYHQHYKNVIKLQLLHINNKRTNAATAAKDAATKIHIHIHLLVINTRYCTNFI